MQPLPIGSNGPQAIPGAVPGTAPGQAPQGTDFKGMLQNYVDQVNQLQTQADKAVVDLASGKMDNLHQVVAAIDEADLSFRLMMEIRNKLLDAYNEIMHMQV
jgi:flagellar hook-basal body complex protein FliE